MLSPAARRRAKLTINSPRLQAGPDLCAFVLVANWPHVQTPDLARCFFDKGSVTQSNPDMNQIGLSRKVGGQRRKEKMLEMCVKDGRGGGRRDGDGQE